MMIAAARGDPEDGEHHDTHAGTEKTAIDGGEPLKDEARKIAGRPLRTDLRTQPRASGENGGGGEKQPWNQLAEGRIVERQQKQRAGQPADDGNG
ncbi:hypothetical protein D3C86_1811710 [compost metagenome]